MRTTRIKALSLGLFVSVLALSQAASAHPGHGSVSLPPESVAHYALEPLHLLPAIGAGLSLYFAVRWVSRGRWRRRFER